MDKEEAMKILKDFHDKSALFSVRTALETLHPELKESEDKEIREQIVYAINKLNVPGSEKNKLLTWLEKQGEQKQYDIDVLEKHITKDSISELAHTVIVRNGWEIVDAKEQNPVWSEEDEEHYKACLQYFDSVNPDMVYYKDYQWLKSLKQRIGG